MAHSVQHSTIKNYLLAIKHYHSTRSYELSLSAFLRLQLILLQHFAATGPFAAHAPMLTHLTQL